MLTFVYYSVIFACGMLAAYVDWEKFLSSAFSFRKVKNPVDIPLSIITYR